MELFHFSACYWFVYLLVHCSKDHSVQTNWNTGTEDNNKVKLSTGRSMVQSFHVQQAWRQIFFKFQKCPNRFSPQSDQLNEKEPVLLWLTKTWLWDPTNPNHCHYISTYQSDSLFRQLLPPWSQSVWWLSCCLLSSSCLSLYPANTPDLELWLWRINLYCLRRKHVFIIFTELHE